MNPHRMAFGFAYHFPYVAIIAGVTMFAWFTSSEPTPFPWTRETFLQILFCLWITFTTFFALFHEPSLWFYWNRAIKVQIMIFMTLLLMKNRVRLETLVWTIVLSIGFFGIKGGLWAILKGGSNRVQGPEMSFITGNNEIALALVMVLPLMRYLQLNMQNKWIRRGLTIAQVLMVLGILTTYSRGGVVALCVVGLLMWLKSRHKLSLAIAMLLVIPPLILFMPQQWKDRMHTIKATDEGSLDASAEGRLNAWRFAWNLVKDRPLVGGGFHVFISDAFYDYAPNPNDRHDAHSIYFEVLGEQGFPGIAIFLALGFFTWRTGRWVIRASRISPELTWAGDMVAMLQVGLAGYATGGMFAGLAYFDLPYHMMAIIILCKLIVRDHIRAEATQEANTVVVMEPVVA
jgi:probable O-glycosylation ligase (exosortase A-associated)